MSVLRVGVDRVASRRTGARGVWTAVEVERAVAGGRWPLSFAGFPPWAVGMTWSDDLGQGFDALNSLVSDFSGDTTVSTFGSLGGNNKWRGGVLAPNGDIYGIPASSTGVLKVDPATDTVSTFGSLAGSNKW
jgi:hypothetical protein